DSARLRAASVIAAIQPWSAAGAEKPIRTVSPTSSFELPPPPGAGASLVLVALSPLSVFCGAGSLPVQPTRSAPAARIAAPIWVVRRQEVRLVAVVMSLPLIVPAALPGTCGVPRTCGPSAGAVRGSESAPDRVMHCRSWCPEALPRARQV